MVLGLFKRFLWSPGKQVSDGRRDLRKNGIWLQHGWIGDDNWFRQNNREKSKFRSDEKVQSLAALLKSHGITYVYPHLCPCRGDGTIASCDAAQTERLLNHFSDFSVIPWIGGVLGAQCDPASGEWRRNFVTSVGELFENHPRLGGVQINIEPMPSGNQDFLKLLRELKAGLPEGKILSVAAYPPPTSWHPHEEVHWDEGYFREVAQSVDQMVPMMYDTAIRFPKFYQQLMSKWAREVILWSGDAEVLLGIPTYDDAGVGYHDPRVENLGNAISGIHAGLEKEAGLPPNYSGIAIYCEWETDQDEWDLFKSEFEKR